MNELRTEKLSENLETLKNEETIAFYVDDLETEILKTLAMYVPVTEQLLDSANISDVLMNACSKEIATALDKALLYGTGTGAEIKGISAHTNINKVSHTGNVDYSMLIKGIGATKTANVIPQQT